MTQQDLFHPELAFVERHLMTRFQVLQLAKLRRERTKQIDGFEFDALQSVPGEYSVNVVVKLDCGEHHIYHEINPHKVRITGPWRKE